MVNKTCKCFQKSWAVIVFNWEILCSEMAVNCSKSLNLGVKLGGSCLKKVSKRCNSHFVYTPDKDVNIKGIDFLICYFVMIVVEDQNLC